MANLITETNIQNPDELYQMLIDSNKDLTNEQCLKFNAKLILLVANHIGDINIIKQAIEIARPK